MDDSWWFKFMDLMDSLGWNKSREGTSRNHRFTFVWLVVGIATPLKMMEWKSVRMMTFPINMESHKNHVPNHQPVVLSCLTIKNREIWSKLLKIGQECKRFFLNSLSTGAWYWCPRAEHVRGHEFALRNSLIMADIDFSIDLTLIAIGKTCWISMWVGLCYVIYFGHLHGHQWVASRNPKNTGKPWSES